MFLKNTLEVPLLPEGNSYTIRPWLILNRPRFYGAVQQRYLVILTFTLMQLRNVHEVVATVITWLYQAWHPMISRPESNILFGVSHIQRHSDLVATRSVAVQSSWYCSYTTKIQSPWHLFSERKHKVHHSQLIRTIKKFLKKNHEPNEQRLSRSSTLLNSISNLIYTDNPAQLAPTGASKKQWHSQAIDIFTAPPISAWWAVSANERLRTWPTRIPRRSRPGPCVRTSKPQEQDRAGRGHGGQGAAHQPCSTPPASVTRIECFGRLRTWEQNLAVPVWSLPKI